MQQEKLVSFYDRGILAYCASLPKLEDSCIQNFHLWRFIFGYTVGNLVFV